jgi:hypothetical protein
MKLYLWSIWKNPTGRVNQQETKQILIIIYYMKKISKRSVKKISQPSNLVSSETTREAPLNKSFYFNYYLNNFKPQHIKVNNFRFLEWFIGFSEGDDSFIISNKRCYFCINQKDIKILYKIKAHLGFGQVFKYIQNNTIYGRYIVQDQKNCERLANIFNGNLVLNKTNARFKIWIKELKIIPLKTKGFINLENAWLSGFIDAKGFFYARVRKHSSMKLKYKVERKFIINQKEELYLFEHLKELFFSNATIQKIQTQNSIYYKIELSSMLSNDLLLNYLNKFPCKGNKNISLNIYNRIHGYIKREEHLTIIGLQRIRNLCKNLNKQKLII